jgi:hypothetical protein
MVQDAHEGDAARVRDDLLRWYDQANASEIPVGESTQGRRSPPGGDALTCWMVGGPART